MDSKNMDSKYDHDFKGDGDDPTLEVERLPSSNTGFNLAEGTDQLERGLKSRHIQFLALGMASLPICSSRDRRN